MTKWSGNVCTDARGHGVRSPSNWQKFFPTMASGLLCVSRQYNLPNWFTAVPVSHLHLLYLTIVDILDVHAKGSPACSVLSCAVFIGVCVHVFVKTHRRSCEHTHTHRSNAFLTLTCAYQYDTRWIFDFASTPTS